VATLVACTSAYLIVAMYYWYLPPLAPVMAELAMTVVVYALIVPLLVLVHRHLVGPLRSDI
ncbi:MAG: hypothetical protein JO294_00795, partial [Alphaproteobacteria bacterium]|nr:hypothetical protein [Alphaproteobacteria bacterium]